MPYSYLDLARLVMKKQLTGSVVATLLEETGTDHDAHAWAHMTDFRLKQVDGDGGIQD